MPPVPKHIPREEFKPLPRCQAYNRKGYQCSFPVVTGKRVCRYHGGLSLGGAASPTFKTGRYSKYLPAALLEKVNEAAKDTDLLSLREEITVLDARLMELFGRVEEGGGTSGWLALNSAWNSLLQAQRKGDQDKARDAAQDVNKIIASGLHDSMIWVDIRQVIEDRRRLVQTESRRLTDMQQMVTAERAMALVLALADIVRSRLNIYRDNGKTVDDKLVRGIGEDIRRLITIPERVEK